MTPKKFSRFCLYSTNKQTSKQNEEKIIKLKIEKVTPKILKICSLFSFVFFIFSNQFSVLRWLDQYTPLKCPESGEKSIL